MDTRDRRAALLDSTAFNGIDFVEVANNAQTRLVVHFLNGVSLAGTLSNPPAITGGETIRTVAVRPFDDNADWGTDGDHVTLSLTVLAPGDFSNYTLTLQALTNQTTRLDPYFAQAVFSFKARCPSDLDCEAAAAPCPPTPADRPPIDYLAKDFLGFRRALLDFSTLRYPEWQERSEADFGMMFLEALSALADDLSYTQDRIARETALETASQRRSVVQQARLVDYEPGPVTSATVLLQFNVGEGIAGLPDGLVVTAVGPDGVSVPFETGSSLRNRLVDPLTGDRRAAAPTSPVKAAWNSGAIQPYWFDDSQRCLAAGVTEMFVLGHGHGFYDGQPLLLDTAGATSIDPPIRQVVYLINTADPGAELHDPVFGHDVTRIAWAAADALQANHDLTKTVLAGNLVAASQGLTLKASAGSPAAPPVSESFVIPPGTPEINPAIVRTGPNDTPAAPALQYLYSLAAGPVTWLQPAAGGSVTLPEILVENRGAVDAERQWTFLRRLLEAEPFENAFTLDAARYTRLGRNSDGSTQYDYDGDGGDTIRFGDGTFGEIPVDGTIFDVTYRAGVGAAGNVAADAITLPDAAAMAAGVTAVTNPLPAGGGADAEPLDQVRRLAPQAFRAKQYRAVRPEDYEAAAQTLSWVQKAGTVFRWTGSWLTVFTTTDPAKSEQITPGERTEAIDLLNRYRLAGYESYVPEAKYVSVDLAVQVCASPEAFRGDVEEAVRTALGMTVAADGTDGFFDPDHFTFGQSLERSDLEAAVQNAAGVAGVTCILYRLRNRTAGWAELPGTVAVAHDEIIRCNNDLNYPERGSLKITVRGGK